MQVLKKNGLPGSVAHAVLWVQDRCTSNQSSLYTWHLVATMSFGMGPQALAQQQICSCLRGAMGWSLKPARSLLDILGYAYFSCYEHEC